MELLVELGWEGLGLGELGLEVDGLVGWGLELVLEVGVEVAELGYAVFEVVYLLSHLLDLLAQGVTFELIFLFERGDFLFV